MKSVPRAVATESPESDGREFSVYPVAIALGIDLMTARQIQRGEGRRFEFGRWFD